MEEETAGELRVESSLSVSEAFLLRREAADEWCADGRDAGLSL